MNEVLEKRAQGRPEGKKYPHVRSLRFDERTVERLRQLAGRLEVDQSDVVRRAIRELAEKEGVE